MSVKQLATAEALWEMPEVPGKNLELTDGQVAEVSSSGAVARRTGSIPGERKRMARA